MKWVLVSLWLLGAVAYAAPTFYSGDEERSDFSETLVLDTRPGLPIHAIDPSTSPRDILRRGTPQVKNEMTQPLKTQASLGDLVPPPVPAQRELAEQSLWGQLLRGAPVHSAPSASSELLGYASPGTEMQIAERSQGWARVIDPATSNQGWVIDRDITIKEGPSGLAIGRPENQQEAALETDADLAEPERPKRSVKAKRTHKHYAKKRGRKHLRFGFGFRRF
jgi:Bacterial SH3 domain